MCPGRNPALGELGSVGHYPTNAPIAAPTGNQNTCLVAKYMTTPATSPTISPAMRFMDVGYPAPGQGIAQRMSTATAQDC